MSPEYVIDGIISVKSDIFSFGVLILEIISGKRSKTTYYSESQINLLGCVSIILTSILTFFLLHISFFICIKQLELFSGMEIMESG